MRWWSEKCRTCGRSGRSSSSSSSSSRLKTGSKCSICQLASVLIASTPVVLASYTYEISPCVTEISRRFYESDSSLQFTYGHDCASDLITLGVSGSANSCSRDWTVLVAQFLLPNIPASTVTEVSFSATVSDPGGGGFPVVMYGLGTRSLDTSGDSTTFHGGYPMNRDCELQ
eukprot:SAG31_NODE_4923_length_2861_cov_1.583997_3_plen_172_part_00